MKKKHHHKDEDRRWIECIECKMFIDYFAYDYDIEYAGHEHHQWRYVTKKEGKELLKECWKDGCDVPSVNRIDKT